MSPPPPPFFPLPPSSPPRVALDEIGVPLQYAGEADQLVPESGGGTSHANTPLSSLGFASLPWGKPGFPHEPPSSSAYAMSHAAKPRTPRRSLRETSRFPGAHPPRGVCPLTRTHPSPRPRSRFLARTRARSRRRTPPRASPSGTAL